MRERIQTRISELQTELETGTRRMQELELEQTRLREVMLRITGAMQVLQELLDADVGSANGAAPSSNGAAATMTDSSPDAEPTADGDDATMASVAPPMD